MVPIKPGISVEYQKEVTVIRFVNEKILEEQDIQLLQEGIMAVIEQSDGIRMVLDFSNVEFLSSAVLGMLIRVSKRIYERDGKLRLCNISPKIYEVFKITRLVEVFDIDKDVETAVAGFSGGA